jgi:cardiolipin synthase
VRNEITLVTPYFIPDEVILRSLIIKAHNGRRVRVVVPDRSNHPIVDLARNHFLRELHGHGCGNPLLPPPDDASAKLLLVDNAVALTGSANLDPRSLFVNFEIGLVHNSSFDIERLTQWVDTRILPHCTRYNEHRRSRNSRLRLMGENLAHLLTPLL